MFFIVKDSINFGYLFGSGLLLQDNRVNPSANGNLAIQQATVNERSAVVKLLLQDKRVNPCDEDNYAMRWAAENGQQRY
jgi:hypothetical protein